MTADERVARRIADEVNIPCFIAAWGHGQECISCCRTRASIYRFALDCIRYGRETPDPDQAQTESAPGQITTHPEEQ